MSLLPTRRSFMSLVAAVPAVLVAGRAAAFETVAAQNVPQAASITPAGGLWHTLVHATDGTDPSTAIATELPRFTPAIRKLADTQVAIEGYLQPVGTGFGHAEYILSQYPFHCGFCYTGGRASLMLVRAKQPLPETTKRVQLTGTLRLQETTPDDYYYQLEGARVV